MGETFGNFGTCATGFVEGQQKSQHQLGPGQYSLSTLSTVPYVSLIGLAKAEKIFSWGEVVRVPEGATVTIKNASFHGGDIVINGGTDLAAMPQRVTVPVKPKLLNESPGFRLWTGAWGADCRRARRAFVSMFIEQTFDQGQLATGSKVGGSKGGHSHFTANRAFPFYTGIPRIPGYYNDQAIPQNTAMGVFPLGYNAQLAPPTFAHALLDEGFFYLVTDDTFELENVYYILEY